MSDSDDQIPKPSEEHPFSSPPQHRPPEGVEAPGTPRTILINPTFYGIAIMIGLGIFATTLPQPQVLGRLPLTFLLKEQLHEPASRVAEFFFICGLFWYIKPIAGILTDAFPIFGTRRRHYMLISALFASISWLAMMILPKTYSALLWGAIIVNLFMVMASTVTGAFLVEAGQSLNATGRFSSLRVFAQSTAQTLNGYLGGLLASVGFLWAAGVNAVLILSLFPITYVFLREQKQRSTASQSIQNAERQLGTIGRSGTFWVAIIFVLLFYFAPGFSTLLTYRQSDVLHFSKQFIGLTQSVGGAAGLLAAVFYGYLIKRFSLRAMLFFGIATAAAGTLFYLFYSGPSAALAIDAQNGFFFNIAEIALLNLAAKATPVGCEGLAYSLLLSARNLALFGADWLGAQASDTYKIPFNTMVWINAGTTAIVLIILPFMPKAIMSSKDARPTPQEIAEEATPEAARIAEGDTI